MLLAALALGVALGAGGYALIEGPGPAVPPSVRVEGRENGPPQLVRLGTGSVTGAYFPVGGALCEVFNARRAPDGPLCAALSGGGSKENLEALRAGGLELALVQSDWHYHAARGSQAFAQAGAMTELRSVLSLYKESLTVLARRDAGVARVSDLKGKRVSVGMAGSGARTLFDAALRAYGLRPNDLRSALELDAVSAVEALCGGAIDAAAFASGHPNGLVGSAAQGCDAVLLPVASPAIDRLVADNPFFTHAEIPGGIYPGNPEPVTSFGVAVTLVASARLGAAVVEGLAAAVASDLEALQAMHPALSGLSPDAIMRDGLYAPLHDGALKAFTARGWR